MRSLIALFFLVALAAPAAAASWSDWHDDMPAGNPAITFNAAGAVSLTLPEATLAEAATQGIDAAAAVRGFLNRWAPGMCSDLADMNRPHQSLAVTLFVQRSIALEDADAGTLAFAAGILNGALAVSPGAIPHIRNVFVVDLQHGQSLTIDYAPDKPAKCVVPEDLTS